MRILLAEDDVDGAEVYKEILENRRHKVTITYNGADCVTEYLAAHDGTKGSGFDVVIVDYSMPNMNGVQVARKILDINQKQQIIFISGYGSELLEHLNGMGSVDFLMKPIVPTALVKLVEG